MCWTLLRRREAIRVRRPDADEVIGLLTRGLPFLGSALLIQAIINLDVIVLGVLRSTRDVGIYSAAFRLAFFALMLAGLVATAVFPQLVHRWQADRMSFQRLLARLIRLARLPRCYLIWSKCRLIMASVCEVRAVWMTPEFITKNA